MAGLSHPLTFLQPSQYILQWCSATKKHKCKAQLGRLLPKCRTRFWSVHHLYNFTPQILIITAIIMKICLAIPGSFAFFVTIQMTYKTNEQKCWRGRGWNMSLDNCYVTETEMIQEGINDLWQHNQVSTSVIWLFPHRSEWNEHRSWSGPTWTRILNRSGNPNERGTHRQWKCFNLTEGNNKDNKW